jgi:glycosyltransferase involved in cell wall biosynthesis
MDLKVAMPRASRRRLLFVLPFVPRQDAIHGGARVMAQLIQALASRHDVAVIYLRERTDQPIDDDVRARLSRVEEVVEPREVSFGARLARRTAALRGVPAWAAYTALPEMGARVRDVATSWRPDIVHFEYHVMGQYVGALPDHNATRILSEFEAGVLASREHFATGKEGGALGDWLQRRAWERFERRIIGEVDAVVVFSDRDREALAALGRRTPIVRIGLGTRLPATPLDPLGATDHLRVVFVGNFMHPPNIDAAIRLTDAVFPAVRARFPDALLRIVGAHPPQRLLSRAHSGVDVTGRVPDVTPWMNAAAVVAVPLRLGGGMRVKVLEALAHGKAVVASKRALEGLDVTDGVQVAMAETDDEFSAKIIELLESQSRRTTMARNAREWATANLGDERWVAEYEALYDTLRPAGARS